MSKSTAPSSVQSSLLLILIAKLLEEVEPASFKRFLVIRSINGTSSAKGVRSAVLENFLVF